MAPFFILFLSLFHLKLVTNSRNIVYLEQISTVYFVSINFKFILFYVDKRCF